MHSAPVMGAVLRDKLDGDRQIRGTASFSRNRFVCFTSALLKPAPVGTSVSRSSSILNRH